MQKNTARKKGFSFLSFFLGFLFGIIVLIGSIAGVIYYALSAKIDDVFGLVGVDNSEDENGNNKIINTDAENGGASTLLELVAKVSAMASDTDNLSVGEVEKLIPALGGVVDGIHGAIAEYVDVERSEFVSVKFADFGSFVSEKVLEIQPAALMIKAGMGESLANPVFSALFYGAEAKYVEGDGQKYPVYYDTYVKSETGYLREGDNAALPAQYEENLVANGEKYRLNYYLVGESCYVTDGEYTYVAPASAHLRVANGAVYSLYNAEYSRLSGNYYIENGEKKVVTPITLDSFNNVEETLEGVYLDTLLTADEENDLAKKVLAGISLGDIMGGKLDFESTLSNLPLTDLVDVKADDGVMMSLIYKINGVEAAVDQSYAYTGTYKIKTAGDEGETVTERPCFIETDENGIVTRAYYIEDGKEVDFGSISVADLMDGFDTDSIMEDMTVNSLMDVNPEEAIMAYLAYGIYGVSEPVEGQAYKYTATYDRSTDIENSDEVQCFVTVKTGEDGKEVIQSVYYYDENNEKVTISGTRVDKINERINNLTYKLKVKELIKTDNRILVALGDCTVNKLGDGVNNLTLGDIFEEEKFENNTLLQSLRTTSIKDLPDRINTLSLKEMMTITQDNTMLWNLRDSTLNTLADDVDKLTLGQIVDVENNFLLEGLADTTIKELPNAMLGLTVNDLYADNVYGVETEVGGEKKKVATRYKVVAAGQPVGEGEIEFNPDYLYYIKVGEKYEYVNKDDKNGNVGKLSALPQGGEYYTYGEAKGMWKMLLYASKEVQTGTDGGGNPVTEKVSDGERAYTLNSLTDMMPNVAYNISNANLYYLHDNQLLVFGNPDDLDRYIDTEHTKTLGQLKLTEAISKFAGLLNAFGSATERPND